MSKTKIISAKSLLEFQELTTDALNKGYKVFGKVCLNFKKGCFKLKTFSTKQL